MEILQAYRSASDLTIQLITLATGILALSITFMRDVIKADSPTWALKSAWVILLLSVVFGVWTLMGITGSIFDVVSNPEKFKTETYGMNIILPSSLQITSFASAIILLIIFCARTLKPKKRKSPRKMWIRKPRKIK